MHNDPDHSDCDRQNADSHLRAMLLGHSLTMQISGGELVLGQWQRILWPSSTVRGRGPSAFRFRGLPVDSDVATTASSRRTRPQIADKVEARERLSFDDGVTLFEVADLLALGWIANRERERRHGDRTYFNHNLRLEATNVCEASCLFCSFARLKEGMPGSHTMSVEQILDKLRQRAGEPVTEVHIVNGLHPGLPFSYYTDLLSGLEEDPPRHSPEVLHRGRDRVLRRSLRQDRHAGAGGAQGRRPRFAARRRRGDLRARACARRSATTSATVRATSRSIAPRTASACAPT